MKGQTGSSWNDWTAQQPQLIKDTLLCLFHSLRVSPFIIRIQNSCIKYRIRIRLRGRDSDSGQLLCHKTQIGNLFFALTKQDNVWQVHNNRHTNRTLLTLTKSSIFGPSAIFVWVSSRCTSSSPSFSSRLLSPQIFFSACLTTDLRGGPHPVQTYQSDQQIWICLCLPCVELPKSAHYCTLAEVVISPHGENVFMRWRSRLNAPDNDT